ncbi:MAG: PorP/SprF family type IX secretion system membrane protein [Bacteroidota bacterium]
MKKNIIIYVILINLCNLCYAQDIHFSQFYQTPLLINPALTGSFNGDMRALINYKDQWRSIASPYKTMALSYDAALLKKKWENSYLGAGFSAFNDRVAKFNWGITQFSLSLSSIISLNEQHKVSAGLQGGIAQRSFNSTNLKWDNQFDGQNYDVALPSSETENFNSRIFGDFSAGVSWSFAKEQSTMSANDHFMANAGVALYHINKPEQNFYSYEINRLYSKLVLHGGTYIGIKNTNITLIPSVLFLKQGPAQEINLGGMIRYRLKQESKYTGFIKEAAVLFGGHYRTEDAFIPSFMLEIANFALGISYDVNTSGLRAASNGQGGVEISLRYITPNPFQGGSGSGLF